MAGVLLDARSAWLHARQVRSPAERVRSLWQHAKGRPGGAARSALRPGRVPRSYLLTRAPHSRGGKAQAEQQAVIAELWPAQAAHLRAQICVNVSALGPLTVPLVLITALWLNHHAELHAAPSQQSEERSAESASRGSFSQWCDDLLAGRLAGEARQAKHVTAPLCACNSARLVC